MKIEEVREKAKKVGLAATSRMRKAEIIRAVQRAEGNQDCFGSAWRHECPWTDCCWRGDCLSKNSG